MLQGFSGACSLGMCCPGHTVLRVMPRGPRAQAHLHRERPPAGGKAGRRRPSPAAQGSPDNRSGAQGLLTLPPGLCRSRHALTVPVMSAGAVACSATPLVLSALQGFGTCPSPSASLPAAGHSPVSQCRQDEGHPPAGGGRGSAKAKEIVLRNSCKELGLPLMIWSCRKWH